MFSYVHGWTPSWRFFSWKTTKDLHRYFHITGRLISYLFKLFLNNHLLIVKFKSLISLTTEKMWSPLPSPPPSRVPHFYTTHLFYLQPWTVSTYTSICTSNIHFACTSSFICSLFHLHNLRHCRGSWMSYTLRRHPVCSDERSTTLRPAPVCCECPARTHRCNVTSKPIRHRSANSCRCHVPLWSFREEWDMTEGRIAFYYQHTHTDTIHYAVWSVDSVYDNPLTWTSSLVHLAINSTNLVWTLTVFL